MSLKPTEIDVIVLDDITLLTFPLSKAGAFS